MSGMINVMLVDDHAVVRMGFKLLLEAAPALTTETVLDTTPVARCTKSRGSRMRRSGLGASSRTRLARS